MNWLKILFWTSNWFIDENPIYAYIPRVNESTTNEKFGIQSFSSSTSNNAHAQEEGMKPAGKFLAKNTTVPITAAGITVEEIKLFKTMLKMSECFENGSLDVEKMMKI